MKRKQGAGTGTAPHLQHRQHKTKRQRALLSPSTSLSLFLALSPSSAIPQFCLSLLFLSLFLPTSLSPSPSVYRLPLSVCLSASLPTRSPDEVGVRGVERGHERIQLPLELLGDGEAGGHCPLAAGGRRAPSPGGASITLNKKTIERNREGGKGREREQGKRERGSAATAAMRLCKQVKNTHTREN